MIEDQKLLTRNQKRLTNLLFCIRLYNRMCREAVATSNEKEAQDYHELCKKYVTELINGPYENRIKLTVKTIYETGKEKACIHCFNLGEYIDALYKKDERKATEIESEYGIQRELESCIVVL